MKCLHGGGKGEKWPVISGIANGLFVTVTEPPVKLLIFSYVLQCRLYLQPRNCVRRCHSVQNLFNLETLGLGGCPGAVLLELMCCTCCWGFCTRVQYGCLLPIGSQPVRQSAKP